MRVIFDPAKDAANMDKHGLSLAVVAEVVSNPVQTFLDNRFDYGEDRFVTFGYVDRRLYVAVWTNETTKSGRSVCARQTSGNRIAMVDNLPEDFDDNPDWSGGGLASLDHAAMLRVARTRLGLSQDAAASMLGLPVATLRNWEQRRTTPDDAAKTLIRLLYEHPEDVQRWLTHAA